MADAQLEETPAPVQRELRAVAELFALCGFAIAYPLLDLYGRAPEVFVFRNADTAQIVGFALVITLVPPAVLWLAEVVVGLVSRRARHALHLGLIAALVAIFAVQALRPLVTGIALLALGGLLGAVAAALYARVEPVRLWFLYASAAPLLFVGLFLTASPTSELLVSGGRLEANAQVGNPVPVVMVVFDELPLASLIDADGQIDRELYPNFASLADGSHWFRNATAVSTSTWHSVPSLVTGRYPPRDRAPLASDHPENLFSLLADSYELRVTESITRLCARELCEPPDLVPGGLGMLLSDATDLMRSRLSPSGHGEDPMAAFVEAPAAEPTEATSPGTGDEDGDDETWADFDLNQPARLRSLLDGLDEADTIAQLHYLHLLLPHVPLRYLPSGAQYPPTELDRDGDVWGDEVWPVTLAHQRHLLQTAYVDGLVGDLTDKLQQEGIYDEALVIVTADHGIAFQPGRASRGLDEGVLDEALLTELMWVPLFVKLPGQAVGEVSDANVSLVDVVPTIADVLDIEAPWTFDGRSVFDAPRTDNTKVFYNSFVNPFGVDAGERFAIDGDIHFGRLEDLRVDRILPARGDALRAWRVGPRADLVGARVAGEDAVEPTPADIDLDDRARFEDVRPRSGTVPALVSGRIAGIDPGQTVTVAINGIVAGTSPVFERGGEPGFAAMVSDEWFRPGANDVTVHLVR